MDLVKISLLGEHHAVALPNFATREELVTKFSEVKDRKGGPVLRVCGAMLGLCTRLGSRAGADYAKHEYNVLAYGGEVYSWLRQQGVSPEEVVRAAGPVLELLARSLFPSDAEVAAARGN